MIKKSIFILMTLLTTFSLSAMEPIWGHGYYEKFYEFGILSESECVLEIKAYNYNENISYTYFWDTSNGIPFIQLDKKLPIEIYKNFVHKGERNVEMPSSILPLIGFENTNGKIRPLAVLFSRHFDEGLFAINFRNFEATSQKYREATSFLVEKDKSYPIENLCDISIDTPWVENAPGYGIGESFIIENPWKRYNYILIINGYISYEKPYLYQQNGRIKKIRVTGMQSGISKVLSILDTPHPQTVDISFIPEQDIKIEIVEVYEGTKYEDTCIHFMITWDKEVIPYKDTL